MDERTLIRGARVVAPRGVCKADIRIEGSLITGIGRYRPRHGERVVDADGLLALPGLVDIHVHGGLGFDMCCGLYRRETHRFDDSDSVFKRFYPKLMRRFAQTGVTRCLLANLTIPLKAIERALAHLADYAESEGNGRDGARLEGAFAEGPFLSNPRNAGTQNPAEFRAPEQAAFDRLDKAARGWIRYVNIAPEYGAQAEALTRYLHARGILVGVGHSDCPAEQVRRCIDAGMRVAVHFLNGPSGASFKPFNGGNVIEEMLRNPAVFTELICDGWHVAVPYVRDVIARKGYSRVALVTDAVFAAGAKGLREFTLGGIKGKLHASGQYCQTRHDPLTLFGSVLTMDRAFGNMLSWLTTDMAGTWHRRHRALETDAALVRTARMCATNPASLLRLDERLGTGALVRGRCADIVLARLDGERGAYRLNVRRTFLAGQQIHGRD